MSNMYYVVKYQYVPEISWTLNSIKMSKSEKKRNRERN